MRTSGLPNCPSVRWIVLVPDLNSDRASLRKERVRCRRPRRGALRISTIPFQVPPLTAW